MTDYELLAGERNDKLARKFAARIEPAVGFVLYGVFWMFGALMLGTVLAVGLSLVATAVKPPVIVAAIVVWGAFLGGIALIVWWYIGWIVHKRRMAAAVVKDGVIVDARVVKKLGDKIAMAAARMAMRAGGQHLSQNWERVEFEHEGVRYTGVAPFDRVPTEGDAAHVLFAPGSRYALAFSRAGHAYPIKWHRTRELQRGTRA